MSFLKQVSNRDWSSFKWQSMEQHPLWPTLNGFTQILQELKDNVGISPTIFETDH